MRDELVPNEATIYGWIGEVFAQGMRRPGYPADRLAEQRCLDQFRAFATGEPEARWWFTSQIGRLEDAVRNALEAEDLRRLFILPPDILGRHPTAGYSTQLECR